ncbi:MAG: bifunctional UDP-N-acetylglucosamine diphosphorylase/glucosamine-1-phosphate N-acetyltransferase GlmU [Thermovirgaceae bacterium]|nr:bifunctional UDP-N-acetylglucosamine diphosphorylase/glucosamine-1-phosphate N-acetyltransferase GlmU [Thermovirgaceae bacterium]
MPESGTGVLILAAGKGTRMKSETPKVLLPLLDEPLLYYPMTSTSSSAFSGRAVVVGHGSGSVAEYLEKTWPGTEVVIQEEQLGTGHAVAVAREWIARFEHVLIIPGDVPLISRETLSLIHSRHLEGSEDCSFLVFEPTDPTGYGRVLDTDTGIRIVEEKDAMEHEKKCGRVNGGIYAFRTSILLEQLDFINRNNAQGEYYLTDIIHNLCSCGNKVRMILCSDPEEIEGVNDPVQLDRISRALRRRILARHMENGLKCVDSESVWIGPGVTIDGDVSMEPFVQIWGSSRIGTGSSLGSFSIVRNSFIGENVHLSSHVVIQDSTIRNSACLGPFAFIRDGSEVMGGAFVGKFVEIKKSTIGEGSKVPHLAYIGDATVGIDSNIGAGTITCNYDGNRKNPTFIGDRCFVGSSTMLVAPVSLGDGSYTAAGSVITKDVPPGSLAIGRARQKNIEGWACRRKKPEEGGE